MTARRATLRIFFFILSTSLFFDVFSFEFTSLFGNYIVLYKFLEIKLGYVTKMGTTFCAYFNIGLFIGIFVYVQVWSLKRCEKRLPNFEIWEGNTSRKELPASRAEQHALPFGIRITARNIGLQRCSNSAPQQAGGVSIGSKPIKGTSAQCQTLHGGEIFLQIPLFPLLCKNLG